MQTASLLQVIHTAAQRALACEPYTAAAVVVVVVVVVVPALLTVPQTRMNSNELIVPGVLIGGGEQRQQVCEQSCRDEQERATKSANMFRAMNDEATA